MSAVPVKAKWGKVIVEIDFVVSEGVSGLKTKLESKTGVPSDRMKLMPKSKGLWKGVLKDDYDFSSIDFTSVLSKSKNGAIDILLMGSAVQLDGPKVKTIFLEDLPQEEAAKLVVEPSGLTNLGNTCYLNSVTQCLRRIPLLRTGLSSYSQSNQLLSSLRDLFFNLDRTTRAFPPAQFVMSTKGTFPQFAQTGPNGAPMQQDAEEFFSSFLTVASNELSDLNAAFGKTMTGDELKGANNVIDAVFGIKIEETLTCDELSVDVAAVDMDVDMLGNGTGAAAAAIEPAKKSYDLQRKLVCNIQGGQGVGSQVNISHIDEGLKLGLEGKITKHSDILGRDSVWTKSLKIARLPPILVVQFGRFYWKLTPDSQDHTGVKCKVMKPVTFQSTLDLFDFCTDDIKKVLQVFRDKAREEEEDRVAKRLKASIAALSSSSEKPDVMDVSEIAEKEVSGSVALKSEEISQEGEDDEETALQRALAMSMSPDENVVENPVGEKLCPVGPGLPDEFQGLYELYGVVTHKGRSADGGHYMGWVKAEGTESDDDWFVFDDDEVSPCKTEDVLKLKGGGDWHMSYLNFYRAKKGSIYDSENKNIKK